MTSRRERDVDGRGAARHNRILPENNVKRGRLSMRNRLKRPDPWFGTRNVKTGHLSPVLCERGLVMGRLADGR